MAALNTTIYGTLTPGLGLYPVSGDEWAETYNAANTALRAAIGHLHVDFHLVARKTPWDLPYRRRWRIPMTLDGPTIYIDQPSIPHPTAVGLTLDRDHAEYAFDPNDLYRPPMPFGGAPPTTAMAARILQAMWGPDPRTFPEPGITIVPDQIEYIPLSGTGTTTVPYGEPLPIEYVHRANPNYGPGPSLWMHVAEPIVLNVKLSKCVDRVTGVQWDDPDEPPPPFDPLVLPGT